MNDVIKNLIERRSCRSYSDRQVEKEKLDQILLAGTYAACGRGAQSPIIVVVQDKDTIETLRLLNARVMGNEKANPFYNAPTVVIVFADKNIDTYIEDGSLAMGNMMNAAFSLGVDSCWIHRAREMFQTVEGEALLEKWGISNNYIGIGNCILGYRTNDLMAAKERKADYIRFVD